MRRATRSASTLHTPGTNDRDIDKIACLGDAMRACLKMDADLKSKADVLMSLKGVGLRAACFLMATCRNQGSWTRPRSPSWSGLPRSTGIVA